MDERTFSALQEKIRELSIENAQLHQERQAIRAAILKMADTLGFTGQESGPDIGKKIIGLVPKYMAMYSLNPEKFKEKFAFMAELAPIIKDFLKE